jgi:hypothetical protein
MNIKDFYFNNYMGKYFYDREYFNKNKQVACNVQLIQVLLLLPWDETMPYTDLTVALQVPQDSNTTLNSRNYITI